MSEPSHCWKCAAEAPARIGFREMCSHCGVDLHCCVNCRYYAPGKPNDCAVPGTDFVRDRERANFCEEFKVKLGKDPKDSLKAKFQSLFLS